MEKRTIEWDADFEECRAAADAGEFDAELAAHVGKRMYQAYRLEKLYDKPFKVGWSISTSTTFDQMLICYKPMENLSDREAKVLFLAASDVFHKLEFGGRTIEEKRKDLRERISKLCDMSAQLELHIQKLTDDPEDADALEEEYQNLFIETIRIHAD